MVAMPLFHIGGSGWALLGIANGGHTVIIREVDPVGHPAGVRGSSGSPTSSSCPP